MRRSSWISATLIVSAAAGFAELGDKLAPAPDHPAIEYFNYLKRPARDPVAALSRRIEQGGVQLNFATGTGYLRSLLEALHVPIESQMAVFSKTSLQADRVEPSNPRTIFFNDSVAVAWVRGGFIELAALDPEQGVIFYTLQQEPQQKPDFLRRDDCLRCHISDDSLGIPGLVARSRFIAPDGMPKLVLGGFGTDHRSPFEERWGGWYVTGATGTTKHMGNTVIAGEEPEANHTPAHLDSLTGKFDTSAYLSPYSDIAALLVFNHQIRMTDLIIRIGWETRAAPAGQRAKIVRDGAKELVDYLLFVDEALLPSRMRGTSGFAERFASEGPRDRQGRSLRQLDLDKRLMRYPASYMIYTQAFDSLPAEAREAIYQRMWQVLSGEDSSARYARLSLADRQAIVEILRETKPGLPAYFHRP
ncbi:MAG TPA: hypothetical protein VLY24_11930 [Bryobacteraceae bacterium]|nr:hypothetical protein [Bryobacteraceae bacterium]